MGLSSILKDVQHRRQTVRICREQFDGDDDDGNAATAAKINVVDDNDAEQGGRRRRSTAVANLEVSLKFRRVHLDLRFGT